jgi:hypothetical protein
MLKRVFFGLVGLFVLALVPLGAYAQPANISQKVADCDPKFPNNCVKPNADGSINVTGSFSLSNYALEGGGNLAAARADLDALVTAASAPAGILGTNASSIASSSNPLDVRVGDGTSRVTVKASGAGAATTDTALVVSQSPNVSTPCSGVPIPINQTGSTDVKTFTNTGHICSIVLVSDTAQKVSIVQGTGSTCGSSTAALVGGTSADSTHGLSLAANGGFAQVSDRVTINLSTTALHLCVLQSGSGLLSGFITVADQ